MIYRNFCVKCHALESEPAGPECKNPSWHTPPEPSVTKPRLPYPDDGEEDSEAT